MADFDDITGWREELAELEQGPAFKQLYPEKFREGPDPKVPVSNVFEYAELLLKHQELREAILVLLEWYEQKKQEDFYKKNNNFDTDNDPTFPRNESTRLVEFLKWYELKSLVGPNVFAFRLHGRRLAEGVLSGKLSSVRSPEAYGYLREKADRHVEFDDANATDTSS